MTDTKTLRELAEKATNGPWFYDDGAIIVDHRYQTCCGCGYTECCGQPEMAGDYYSIDIEHNAAYIAAANPSAVIELLDELTRLRAQVERMREALGPFSEAAHRINYYNGEHYNAPLFALSGDVLTELLDGFEGKRMTVSHLRAARAAMGGVNGG